jgi:hypothetical protein
MREQHKDDIEAREKLIDSIQVQLERVNRMDDGLYDDKLAGEITQERYKVKHEQFLNQKAELNERLSKIERLSTSRLEHSLVVLELSQKAAQIYPKKTPEQKRVILSNLFSKMTLKDGSVSVKYTNFANAIAEKVQITRKLMEEK